MIRLSHVTALVSAVAGLAAAHRSLPAGITCGNQFTTPDTALVIPDPAISWASYRILTCDAPVFWLKAQTVRAGQNLAFSAGIPVVSRFADTRVAVAIIGPGLPNAGNNDGTVPSAILSEVQSGEGITIVEAATNQSTCAHLQSKEMGEASNVVDDRCRFYEPFSGSDSYVLIDQTVVAPQVGEYRIAIFVPEQTTAKVFFACCDWPEDFSKQFDIPEASCPFCGTTTENSAWSSLFYEQKTMAQHAGFPALQDCSVNSAPSAPTPAQCPAEATAAPIVVSEQCKLGCNENGECHSHNGFEECTQRVRWAIPHPSVGDANAKVQKLSIYAGDSVTFYQHSSDQFAHNVFSMPSEQDLATCKFDDASELAKVEQIQIGHTVAYDTPGSYYYACGIGCNPTMQSYCHCKMGQRLEVVVKARGDAAKCHWEEAKAVAAADVACANVGDVRAFKVGDAAYGATSDQCSDFCVSAMALNFMAGAAKGSCTDQGYTAKVEDKTLQMGGFPIAVQIVRSGKSKACHCHSYEEIACDSTGDALYAEHIEEITEFCKGVVNGTAATCPYDCKQPFEVLHYHYAECNRRKANALFTAIAATDLCHASTPAPDSKCPVTATTAATTPEVQTSAPATTKATPSGVFCWTAGGVAGVTAFAAILGNPAAGDVVRADQRGGLEQYGQWDAMVGSGGVGSCVAATKPPTTVAGNAITNKFNGGNTGTGGWGGQTGTGSTGGNPHSTKQHGNTPYACDTTTCTGYLKAPAACTKDKKCPAVLIIPDWNGMNDYEVERANMLAGLGYVGFAADIYGAGTPAENMMDWIAASGKHRGNPALYMAKITAALTLIKSYDYVDAAKVAAIGYCFGGSGIVNMAILGSDVLGVVGYHSGIAPGSTVVRPDKAIITAKVLLHSGVKDDAAADIALLEDVLEAGQATYEIVRYGSGVFHSFTEWNSASPGRAMYNQRADVRSWASTQLFLQELFEGLPDAKRAVAGAAAPMVTSATAVAAPPVFLIVSGKRLNLNIGQAIAHLISFKNWRVNMLNGAKFLLRALLQVMINYDTMTIDITGMSVGYTTANHATIQQRRADVVRKFLVDRFVGSEAEKAAFEKRITAKAAGANGPNRRCAEITVTAIGAAWMN